MDEIAWLKAAYHQPSSALLHTIGELDWLDELHSLLYEKGNK
jgi:hypothetical protein